jgi:hypothetical protein
MGLGQTSDEIQNYKRHTTKAINIMQNEKQVYGMT